MKLTILAGRDEGATTVALSGELDMATAAQLEDQVDRLLADGRSRILVDLSALTFCDSVGLNTLVRGDNRCQADGGWLRVIRSRGEVAHVLGISGLLGHLSHEDV